MDAMGSTYSIVLYGEDPNEMQQAVDASFDEIERLESMLSHYRPDSEWSHVNRHAADGPVRISQELFDLLWQCLEYSRLSDGTFDITVGPLVKTWGFHRDAGTIPQPGAAAAAHAQVGYGLVHLDPACLAVQFEQPAVQLDPGGIGKGYAVDRVASFLRARGFTTALIAASRSTIYGMGAPPAEPRGWPVKVRHPARPAQVLAEVFLKDMSLSASGAGENSFAAEGRVYSHVIDPRSGQPADDIMVAVLAPRAMDSEAWTKPCLLNGSSWRPSRATEDVRFFYFENPAKPVLEEHAIIERHA